MSYTGTGLPVLGVAQSRIFHCPAPRIVVPAGRRLGKTTYAGVRLFRTAYSKKLAETRYIAPYLKQAKDIFWEPLKRMVPPEYILKKHETDLRITLLNGSTIKLLGADNPDALRGPGLDDVVFDEFADIDPKTWFEVIEPSLSDREGTAAFLGTPKGYNHFYDLYQLGLDPVTNPDWRSFAFTTAQGGRVKKSIIEKARGTLDIRVFRQEYEAAFETLSGRVYDNFVDARWPKGNIDPTILDIGGTLYIGLDFNINPMSAVIMQDVNGWPQVVDELELFTSNTEEMGKALRKRYPGRRLVICPDASGQYAKGTNAPQGQTDFTILRALGFEILAENINPVVVDRINNAQSLLRSGSGLRRVTLHPRCAALKKCLQGLTYEEGKNVPNKKLGLDHLADAFGYVLWQRWNVLHNLLPHTSPDGSPLSSPYGSEAA